jgi:hypothetical protein
MKLRPHQPVKRQPSSVDNENARNSMSGPVFQLISAITKVGTGIVVTIATPSVGVLKIRDRVVP